MTKIKAVGYEIMHMDRLTARIDQYGHSKIYEEAFLPYNLWLEEAEDLDTLVNNITNFYYWCASRVLTLDRHGYYMMNLLDYLIGNTDRHWGNWGVLVDNRTNRPISLHKLMDFNQAFHSYDTFDGAGCQTLFGRHATQREAAEEAVRAVGLNQIMEVKKEAFSELPQMYEMFQRRLEHLKTL